jgi:hypothetical protein
MAYPIEPKWYVLGGLTVLAIIVIVRNAYMIAYERGIIEGLRRARVILQEYGCKPGPEGVKTEPQRNRKQ